MKKNTMNIGLGSYGGNGHICSKFIQLLKEPEIETCETCHFRWEDSGDGCRNHDCTVGIKVCKDVNCPKNHFYKKLNWKKAKPTQASRLSRNCEYGIGLITGPLVLEDIARIYGLSRERIRQVELNALVRVGKRIQLSSGIRSLIHVGSLKQFNSLVQRKNNLTDLIRIRRQKRREKRLNALQIPAN